MSDLLLSLIPEAIGILFTVTILAWLLGWLERRKWKAATHVVYALLWEDIYQLILSIYEISGIDISNPEHGSVRVINFHGEAMRFFRYDREIFVAGLLEATREVGDAHLAPFMDAVTEIKPSLEKMVGQYAFLLDANILGYLLAFFRHFESDRPRGCMLATWEVHRELRDVKGKVMTVDEWKHEFSTYVKSRPMHRLFEPEDNRDEFIESVISNIR